MPALRFVLLTVSVLLAGSWHTTAAAQDLAPGDIVVIVHDTVAFPGSGAVIRVDPVTGTQTLISSDGIFASPIGVAVDSKHRIFVSDLDLCDADCGGIIRIRSDSGSQSLVSSGENLDEPALMAIDPGGDLVVADRLGPDLSGAVVRVKPLSGRQFAVSSGGGLSDPTSVAIGVTDEIFVTNLGDTEGGSILGVDPDTGEQRLVSSKGLLSGPRGIAIDLDQDLLVTNTSTVEPASVIRVDSETGEQTVVTMGGSLVTPFGIAIDESGNIWVADHDAEAIIRIDPTDGSQTIVSSGEFLSIDEPGRGVTGLSIVPPLEPAMEPGDEDPASNALGDGGAIFEQPGKLRFNFKKRYSSWNQSSRLISKIKYSSETFTEFGPTTDLAADSFRITSLFSDGVVRLEGTYTVNKKGKVKLDPDTTLITHDLDELFLGDVKKCKVKAKFKTVGKKNEPRSGKTQVQAKCKLKNAKPSQRLVYKAKGKGPEIFPDETIPE